VGSFPLDLLLASFEFVDEHEVSLAFIEDWSSLVTLTAASLDVSLDGVINFFGK